MQRCFDFFFKIIYKIICLCLYFLFHHILWYPFYYFFFFYLELKKIFFNLKKWFFFEFFLRKPKRKRIVIATFVINVFLCIVGTIPIVAFMFLIKVPLEKKFKKWCDENPDTVKIALNYFFKKKTILLYIFITVKNYVYWVYNSIRIFNLNFFFHDVFQNRRIIYKYFVVIRTIFAKLYILYFLLCNGYFDYLYNYLINTRLGIEYDYLNFDSTFVYIIILILLFNINNMFIVLSIIFTAVFQQIKFLNLNEFFLYLNLNWTSEYSYYLISKDYFAHHYSANIDFFFIKTLVNNTLTLFWFNYIDTPVFVFSGFLFFTTVLISWFFFSFLGLYGLFKLNLISLFFFWLSLIFYIKPIFLYNKVYDIKILNWLYLNNNIAIDYYFLIDSISFSFILLTTTIALFVYVYAFSYFRYEPLVDRFLLFLLSFIISMVFLVSSGNLIMLFLGWELIGLTSFFLINFWVTKTSTLKSAFKAFSFNKISDFFLFLFVVGVYNVYFTVDISTLNHIIDKTQHTFIYFNGYSINAIEFLSFMLLFASFIKSAQIGGHIWLPDSMEAPVPASALIHSATLVSAGIYLIVRFNFLFDYTHFFKVFVPLFGSITAAYGGICAVFQTDLKKTLAYSTISHCGFLVILCSLEINEFVILYLYVHGFFKAILFMCIGNVLRVSMGYQDSRRIGGLFKYLPYEYFCSLICVFNLAGLPFTFGFFVKHLLLINLEGYVYFYYIVVFNSFLGAIFGLFYSYNLLYNIFFDFKKGNKSLYKHLNKKKYFSVFYTNSSVASTISIFFLFIFSYILIFYLYKNMVSSNFLFSDFVNTTILNNYYSVVNLNLGFNLNYFFLNVIVLAIIAYLFLKKKRKSMYLYIQFKLCFSFITVLLLLLIFINL